MNNNFRKRLETIKTKHNLYLLGIKYKKTNLSHLIITLPIENIPEFEYYKLKYDATRVRINIDFHSPENIYCVMYTNTTYTHGFPCDINIVRPILHDITKINFKTVKAKNLTYLTK